MDPFAAALDVAANAARGSKRPRLSETPLAQEHEWHGFSSAGRSAEDRTDADRQSALREMIQAHMPPKTAVKQES